MKSGGCGTKIGPQASMERGYGVLPSVARTAASWPGGYKIVDLVARVSHEKRRYLSLRGRDICSLRAQRTSIGVNLPFSVEPQRPISRMAARIAVSPLQQAP